MHKITNAPQLPIIAKDMPVAETEVPAANQAPAAAPSPSPAHERPSLNTTRRSRAKISMPQSDPESAAKVADSRKSSQASSQAGSTYDLDAILDSRSTEAARASYLRHSDQGRLALSRVISEYEKASAPEQHADAAPARPQAESVLKQESTSRIARLLERQSAVPMQWEPNCAPLPGMPNIDWNTVKPTGDLLGSGGFGCVVRLQANRIAPAAAEQDGNVQEKYVQLAAKFIFDEHGMHGQASGDAGAADKLQEELAAYRSIIEARPGGKTLGGHPNLCEIYGIVSMKVDGAEMRALLMEAVPGYNAQKTADILRRCLDANYLSTREYWGVIQYLCDCMLDAADHMRRAGIVHNHIKQDNVLVREDGTVKVIDFGLAAGAAAAEPAEGYGRKFSTTTNERFVGILPKDGAKADFIERTNAQRQVRNSPVNQIETAYSNFVNSALRIRGAGLPVMPDEAKQMDLINDPMMSHEEAQAVIRAAFGLAEIEGKRKGGASWEPRPDARQIAKRLIRHKQVQKTGEGNLTPPSLSRFLEAPNPENYIGLKQHYSNTRDQEQIVARILKSIPKEELQILNKALSSSFSEKGESLHEKGRWINDFNTAPRSGREQESIAKLRGYINEASKLFKELKAASHPLTPVEWSRFNAVGTLTRTALRLMAEHNGRQQGVPSQRNPDSSQSS